MGQKILLAEDDAALRETLAEVLRSEGMDVVLAVNGQNALEVAEAESPAVAVLDCLLPKVNGFDVAKTLRVKNPDMPLVFITGVFKSPQQQQEAKDKYGAKAYLTKPFDAKRLVDAVRPLLFSASGAAGGGGGGAPQQPLPESGNLLENPVMFLCWRAAKEQHSGALELFGERERARVFIFKGRAIFAQHSDPTLNVGVELIRNGALAAEQYKTASDLAVQRGTGLYDVLKGEGIASDGDMKVAYKSLIPKVLERVVALSGRFRWVAGEAFSGVLPAVTTPLLDPLYAGLRKVPEREVEPHITPRRPLRIAPGEDWSEVAARLLEACGSDSLGRAINGRATIAQLIEAAANPNERASRCRQVYLLMSTMSVRASLEPIPMGAPAPMPEPIRPVAPDPIPVAPVRPSVQVEQFETSGPMRAAPAAATAFDEAGDEGVVFTPDEDAARKKVSDKLAEIADKDFYAVLGLKRGADAAAVKKNYFALARDFHTDSFAGLNLGATQKKLDHVFQTIQTAYATLTDEKKRGEYEAKLAYQDAGASTDVAAILAAEAEMHKARLLVDRGELVGALKLIEKVLTVAPKNDEALGYKAYCTWYQTKNPADAHAIVKQLETHYRAQPGSTQLKEFQGWILMETGDLKGAKFAFKKVLEADAQQAGANRGMRQLQRKIEEAEKKNSGLGKFLKR